MKPDRTFTVNLIALLIIASITTYTVLEFTKISKQGSNGGSRATSIDCFMIEQLYQEYYQLEAENLQLLTEKQQADLALSKLAERLNVSIVTIPYSRIERKDVNVQSDRVILYIDRAFPVKIGTTGSMQPWINQNALVLEVKPQGPEQLRVGDVIGYESKNFNTTIIHRITNISNDDQGWYAITKGDANSQADPYKVRFDHVLGVLVALIY